METNNTTAPQGKGMAVTGFVLALVGLVFYFGVAIAVAAQAVLGGGYGLGIFWLLLCLAGTGLSVMGMMKLGKTGGKKGLAIAGLIIGLIASILTLLLVMGIGKMQKAGSMMGDKFGEEWEKAMDKAKEDMNNSLDTMKVQ